MSSDEKYAKYGVMIIVAVGVIWFVWHYFSLAMAN